MALLRRSLCAFGALSLVARAAPAAHGQGGGGKPSKGSASGKHYTADWASLDARPLPEWYDEAKFGIFIHWGVFSVPAWGNESEWYWWGLDGVEKAEDLNNLDRAKWHENINQFQRETYGVDSKYQDFAASFQAKLFDPDEWAELFKKAGARYVVLTSKHHEGFTMWPSKYSSNWNAMDIGPHRDLVGDLTKAVRAKNMTMGLYHSMYEWFHPLYLEDKKNNYATRRFPEGKTIPELREIVEKYRPEVIFSDGEWDADAETYWGSQEFLAWLYNDSPVRDTVVVNDRWGNTTRLKHGDYYSGEDRQQAGSQLLGHKWENCMTIDQWSWGYSRTTHLSGFLSATDILRELSATVAYGGNLLLNVGPTADGTIPPLYQERLVQVGDFLRINGAAVYGTRPSKVQNETGIEGAYYTTSRDQKLLYLTIIQKSGYWPRPGSTLDLKAVRSVSTVELLTADEPYALECADSMDNVQCTMPSPFDAGLLNGAVSRLGFTLQLTGAHLDADSGVNLDAVVAKYGVNLAPFMDQIHT